jgi:hypothetical protein
MAAKCRLLVAVTPMGYMHARRALHEHFDLVPAFSLQQALSALKHGEIEAVLCSIHFDESRMFDLLRAATETDPGIPVACCILLDSKLSPDCLGSLIEAAKSKGARGLVDYNRLHREVGFVEADRQFREEVLRLFGRDCGDTRSRAARG